MPSGTQTGRPGRPCSGWDAVISALMIVFMLFDGGVKILKLPAAVEGTIRLGYPASAVQPIEVIALGCVLLLWHSAYLDSGRDSADRVFGRSDFHPGSRPGRVVHLPPF